MSSVPIRILFFARTRELTGLPETTWETSQPITAADLRAAMLERFPELAADNRPLLLAVNQELAQDETMIQPGDEVAFFPPVTGG